MPLRLIWSPPGSAVPAPDAIGEEIAISMAGGVQALGMIIRLSDDHSGFQMQMLDGTVWSVEPVGQHAPGALDGDWTIGKRLW